MQEAYIWPCDRVIAPRASSTMKFGQVARLFLDAVAKGEAAIPMCDYRTKVDNNIVSIRADYLMGLVSEFANVNEYAMHTRGVLPSVLCAQHNKEISLDFSGIEQEGGCLQQARIAGDWIIEMPYANSDTWYDCSPDLANIVIG